MGVIQKLGFLFLVCFSSSSAQRVGMNLTVICPDGQFECFGDMTCCPLSGNHYGCCPYPDATCCADMQHCCPADTTCDLAHGLCRREDGDVIPFTVNMKASPRGSHSDLSEVSAAEMDESFNEIIHDLPNDSKQVCPGGIQTCADGYTCCPSPYGDYGCCPIEDAVCCSDKIHCCPKGSECDVQHGRCNKKQPSNGKNIVCPGGEFQCPDYTTCCVMTTGQYGCCPLQSATCCPDKLHCCPSGYNCNSAGMCYRSNIPWSRAKYETIPAVKVN